MMYCEFIELIDDTMVPPTQEDYDIIECVYTYHPSIADKRTIATLYNEFGMTIINDMLPRAKEIKRIEEEISRVELALKTVTNEYEQQLEKLHKEYNKINYVGV